MGRRPKLSTSKTFPYRLNTDTKEPPTLTEYWYGDKKKHQLTGKNYDKAVQSYEDTFGSVTFECDCVVFNLEEWADTDCFYPEDKKDKKPFNTLNRRSYKIALRCETWWKDCCYKDNAGHGRFFILSDNGFYDDLKAIGNKYIRGRIDAAFRAFLTNQCVAVNDASEEDKSKWEPNEWHATYWGSPLD